MPTASAVAYLAVEPSPQMGAIVESLHQHGFQFNGPARLAPWFEARQIAFTPATPLELMAQWPQYMQTTRRQLVVPAAAEALNREELAEQHALLGYLLGLADENTVILTAPEQFGLIQTGVLVDTDAWQTLARQLRNDLAPQGILPLRQTVIGGVEGVQLYSLNPAWGEALDVLTLGPTGQVQASVIKNALFGAQLLIQLARTEGLGPVQTLLMQHGWPVHVSCGHAQLAPTVAQVVFQYSPLTPGGTLVASHPLTPTLVDEVAQAGIKAIVAPEWDPESLSQARRSQVITIAFSPARLQLSGRQVQQVTPNTVQYVPAGIDARQIVWQTPDKPEPGQMEDLELGVALADMLPACSAIIIREQQSLAIVSGQVHPTDALTMALERVAGESKDAVCIVSGDWFDTPLLNALSQAGIAGVLLLSPAPLSTELISQFKKLPFFVGTYADCGLGQALERVGVRHG